MATLSLIGQIEPAEISARFVRDALAELGDVPEIEMFLHSDGGDVAEGFAIFHQLVSHPARIVGHVHGLAASMASVVLMAADEIRMAENSFLVIHNPFFPLFGGEAKDLRQAADLLDAFKKNAIRAYRRHSSLSEEELSALMDAETWLTAEEAVEKGFAHTVSGRVEAVNRLDLSRFERVPKAARALLSQPSQGDTQMSDKDKPAKPAEKPTEETVEGKAEETVEGLWSRLGQMIFRRASPERETKSEGVLTESEAAAVLALERQALCTDRARLRLDQDLAPHRTAIEPAQLEKLEPILLKLKTAELAGDKDAGGQYTSLTALLPSLKSTKAGGELAGSDAGSMTASTALSEVARSLEERHGIDDKRREALMKKYPGYRPGISG